LRAAVAVSAPLSGSLVAIGTEGCCGLRLDQGLQPLAHQFRYQFAGGADAKHLRQLGGSKIGDGHGLVLRRC